MKRINQLTALVLGLVIGGFYAGKSLAGEDGAIHWDHSGGNLVTLPGINNVGIGTNSPAANLEVSGSTGIIVEGNNPALSLEDLNDGTTWKFHVDDRLMISESGSEKMRIQTDGNVGIGISTGITEKVTIQGNILLRDDGGSKHTMIRQQSINTNIKAELSTNSKLRLETPAGGGLTVWGQGGGQGSFVGIGTDDPSAKLEVVGQVKITGGSPGVGKVLTSDAAGLASWENAAGGGGGDDDWVIGSGVISNISHNVGIGTNTPAASLEVSGSTGIIIEGNNPALSLEDLNDGTTWKFHVDDRLMISESGNEKMRIQTDGNVGIGISTGITEKVTIQGNILLRDDGGSKHTMIRQQSINTNIKAELSTNSKLRLETPAGGGLTVWGQGGGQGSFVGIGTDDPAAKLVVADGEFHMLDSGGSRIGKLGVAYGTGLQLVADRDIDSILKLSTAAGGGLFVVGKGNTVGGNYIGIDTTGPTERLDVDGGGRFRQLPADDSLDSLVVVDATGVLHTRGVASLSGGPQGAQGKQGPAGNDGATGAQGPPGPGSACVNCDDIETVAFTAVCKIFAGDISNTDEVSICVGVIANLILVDADVCAPNETDCLSVILGNVDDLIQELNNP